MNLNEILISTNLSEIVTSSGVIVLLALSLIEISPIKIDPWTKIATSMGHLFNGEVIEKMCQAEALMLDVKADVANLRDEFHESEAINSRTKILRFGDEVRHGDLHSKEHFDEILSTITSYEKYCEENPNFVNNRTKLTSELIKKVYTECIENNSFI